MLRGRRQELHASIAKTLEEQIVRPPGEAAPVGESVAPLAYHWLRAEAWDKALDYTLEAAERARRLLARPEAINHYWQALELIERLPHTPELDRVHCNVILSLIYLPGWVRDDQAETRLFRHVEEALKNATESGQIADVARLEALKGRHQDDEALLKSALVRASSGDTSAEAFCANYYGTYLGQRGQFVASLDHIERAVDSAGAEGNQLSQARTMVNGRCYSSRAGKLDQALVLAGRVSDIADALDSAELRAWRAWEAEPYFYKCGIKPSWLQETAGRVGDRRVVRGILFLRLAGARPIEVGTAGQSPGASSIVSSKKRLRACKELQYQSLTRRSPEPRSILSPVTTTRP